jgi:hypothetical protein
VKRNKRTFLELETLEDRWVPANVTFVSGFLIIGPSSGEAAMKLTVTQTAANSFKVVDGAATLGTFASVGHLLITGTNGADSITVNLGAFKYTGSIDNINAGNGNDTINITAAGGGVGGNITILPGLGNDSVSLNNAAGSSSITVGGQIQVSDSGGNDSISMGNATGVSSFLGNVSLTGMNNITLAFGKADVYGGDLSASTAGESVPLNFNTTSVPTVVTINGNLQLTGGAGDDTVVDSALVVNKNVTINLGGSTTAIFGNFVSSNTGSTPLSVGGNFSYTGAGLLDELILAGNTVGGNMSLSLGDGNDVVDLSTAGGAFASPVLSGNLSITAGNGNDTFDGLFGEGITATVGGTLSFNVGNGNDTASIVHGPGGGLTWLSGNGNDSVTFGATGANGEFFNVNMRFGTGNDTLTLAGGTVATPNSLSGFIDMGGPPAGNSFDPTGQLAAMTWVTVSPFTLQNV